MLGKEDTVLKYLLNGTGLEFKYGGHIVLPHNLRLFVGMWCHKMLEALAIENHSYSCSSNKPNINTSLGARARCQLIVIQMIGTSCGGCLNYPPFFFLQSLWWNAPEIVMVTANVFLDPAIAFLGFWAPIVREVNQPNAFLKSA